MDSADRDNGEDSLPVNPDPPSIRDLPAEAVVELIENIPTEERRELLSIIGAQYFSGPLPPPDLLRQYDEVVPGFAKTIASQFVAQGDHRREMERAVILSDVARANWGLALGFILALVGVSGSLYLINSGMGAVGLTAFIASLAPLVFAFLESSRRRRKERREKDVEVPE